MFLELAAVGVLSLLVWEYIFTQDTPALHGVYSQPGRWFHWKRITAYVALWHWKWKKQREVPQSHPTGYGIETRRTWEMELPRKLGPDAQACDSVYFNGMDHKGTYFVLRIGRRHDRKCEVWLSLQVPDGGYLQSPVHPDTAVYNTDGVSFSAAGLRFECLEPMRRWRITYNGMLRKGLQNHWQSGDASTFVHVKFDFIWEAFTDVYDFETDYDPWLLSHSLAREKWTNNFWVNLKEKSESRYEQWGEMHGTFSVEGAEETQMNLRGVRSHTHGIKDWRSYHRCVRHIGHIENGATFNITTMSQPGAMSYVHMGYASLPCGLIFPLAWTDQDLPSLGEFGSPPEKYSINFVAGGRSYYLEVSSQLAAKYYHHEDWGAVVTEKLCEFTLNGTKGSGIAEFCERYNGSCPVPRRQSVPLLAEMKLPEVPVCDLTAFVLPFALPACTSSSLVGGKGCQLALLTQLNSKDFQVPGGFCLTIEAFQMQLQKCPELASEIKEIHKIASGQQSGTLSEACDRIVEKFKQVEICDEIRSSLTRQLQEQFSGSQGRRFAVRSSAVGEDGAEMSAAGQMDTILGAKGADQMLDAVKQCWASHFAFTAVEYRRQHGQPVTSSMGVVIQEMVPADISGVLFTQDPLTGHPGRMTINANYGLGESVVSGSAEPDSITLSKSCSGSVSIFSTSVGEKRTRIEMTGDGGTCESEVNRDDGGKCSLSEGMALRLAGIGVQLEKAFSDPRDIEWAIRGEDIYLLQARPITTLSLESDWAIMHEFDTPLATDNEVLTTANIGEMMPGAMTPLTVSTFFRGSEFACQETMVCNGSIPRTVNLQKFQGMSMNHGFINLHCLYGMCEGHVFGSDKRMADLAILGEVYDDVTAEHVQEHWGRSSLLRRVINGIRSKWDMYDSYRRTKEWENKLPTYTLGEHKTAASLYGAICDKMPDYLQCWSDTVTNSGNSAVWSSVLMAILTRGEYEWTVEHYSDVALLLSKCEGVYSADVPSALQDLSSLIRGSDHKDAFVNMTPEDAVSWLTSSAAGKINAKYREFLKRHGQRCIREAEFREKSWQTEPAKFVAVLQTMLKAPAGTSLSQTGVEDATEAIAKLKSPVTFMGRQALKRVVPIARRAVGSREWGKSISIEMVEKFKQAYWKLAALMRQEGYLPDEDLLFFFTHQEIGKVLAERPGRLIAKAQKRRRLHGKMMDVKHKRLNKGHPVPMEDSCTDQIIEGTVTLKGTPVSQGKASGVARIVTSLSDAATIQPGDILVVCYTDVGWSPYFPLISGLVTEIGGLLSHDST